MDNEFGNMDMEFEKMGFWESMFLGEIRFGAIGIVSKMRFEILGCWENGILGKYNFGKMLF